MDDITSEHRQLGHPDNRIRCRELVGNGPPLDDIFSIDKEKVMDGSVTHREFTPYSEVRLHVSERIQESFVVVHLPAVSLHEMTSNNVRGPKPTRVNAKNYTSLEDEALVNSYLYTSEDAVLGNNRKAEAFYTKVHETYLRLKDQEHDPRAPTALRSRFDKIDSACKRFHAVFTRTKRKSGTNYEDWVKAAKAEYLASEKKPFQFEHCWKILKNHQKWMNAQEAIRSDRPEHGCKKEKQLRQQQHQQQPMIKVADSICNALSSFGKETDDAELLSKNQCYTKEDWENCGDEKTRQIMVMQQDIMLKLLKRRLTTMEEGEAPPKKKICSRQEKEKEEEKEKEKEKEEEMTDE